MQDKRQVLHGAQLREPEGDNGVRPDRLRDHDMRDQILPRSVREHLVEISDVLFLAVSLKALQTAAGATCAVLDEFHSKLL